MATKKSATKTVTRTGTKRATRSAAIAAKKATKSMPKRGKNPEGGLTTEGRAYFAKKDGSHLKPGVTGAADTPEKQRRKGSFLVRSFTHPRGPMIDAKGEPTRLALSAHAWGEAVPKTEAAAKKLAVKGQRLLEKYRGSKETSSAKKSAVKKAASKKTVAKEAAGKPARSTR
jgi:Domain of unknown function (DUF6321)